MPDDRKEPQSYGSQNDWNSGKTGQAPNDPKSGPPPDQAAFYESRIEGERSAPHQGGDTSPVQMAESDPAVTAGAREIGNDESTAPGVTSEEGGARRDSYFKRRDYES
jgi:hypothetical protein